MAKVSIYSPESLFHTTLHLVTILLMFWILIFPPLWIAIVAIIIWELQFKVLGRCFLTRFAHSRGIMIGMTYWEYVAYLFKIKKHKKAGHMIDNFLKLLIILILLFRIIKLFY